VVLVKCAERTEVAQCDSAPKSRIRGRIAAEWMEGGAEGLETYDKQQDSNSEV
jgi:hypothetical protein